MSLRFLAACLATMIGTATCSPLVTARQTDRGTEPIESRVRVGNASLYVRAIGQGRPIVVLHGGPDFDHGYLLPDLDRLKDAFRLIYYDQRGRGRSADGVQPEDVTLASDIDDIDKVRAHVRLESAALLGHSWGTVLALEYALRYPNRVSHLVLMNPAPAFTSDLTAFRKVYVQKLGPHMERQRALVATAAYKEGDPDAVYERYRLHFKPALSRSEDYEKLMAAMKAGFIRQGREGIVKARAVEDRLMRDSWEIDSYDLLPKLRNLKIPALVIAGDHDFFPLEVAAHIAKAMPNARLVTFKACGHFAYLECPTDVRNALADFFKRPRAAALPPSPVQSAAPPVRTAAEPAIVIQGYKDGLAGVRAANPDVHLRVGRDPSGPDEPVLFVEYPAPTADPAGRDVHCDAEAHDWTAGRALSFHVKPEQSIRISVSFLDRHRVAYTAWTDLKGGEWQRVRIPFDEIRPNPYFQPPGAKTGEPIDVSAVTGIAFAPQDRTAGRLAIGTFVVSN